MVHTSPIWNPQHIAFRGIMLFGICFLTFGSYYVYDIPSALQANIMQVIEVLVRTKTFIETPSRYF